MNAAQEDAQGLGISDSENYGLVEPRSLISFLSDADVRLVRLEYLIELRESGRVLPRRQEAEAERTASDKPALVGVDELKEVMINEETAHMSMMVRNPAPRRVKVRIVSVSHVWESMQHPDPWRFQLDNIVDAYRPRQLDSLVWIFLDFVSLYQYHRDEAQYSLFQRALQGMHILYAHETVEVHRIEELTPQSVRDGCVARIPVYWDAKQTVMEVPIWELELNFTPYDARGWCQAERQWATLRASLKSTSVPLPPEMFRAQMQDLKFTHRNDSETVFELQKKVFHQKVSSTTKLMVEDLDAKGLAVLLAALPSYRKLQELVANAVPEPWKLVLAVVEAGATKLQVDCESLWDEDAVALAAGLSGCAHLERLHLKCATIGELGSNALRQMSAHLGIDLALTIADRAGPGQEAEPVPPAPLGHPGQARTALRIQVSKRKRPQRPERPDPPAQVPAESSHVDSPSVGGAGKRPLSIHGLGGFSFQLAVDPMAMGWEVVREVAAKVGRPAESLVLTSGSLLDLHQPLLQQVGNDEVAYVARCFGAGRAAASLQKTLAQEVVSPADACALNEVVSLTFGSDFNQSLEGTQLPSTLQTLTFGDKFNQSLEGIQLPSTLQTLTFGKFFNQSLEGIQLPSTLQTLTFGFHFNQSLQGIQLPSTLQTLTFGIVFNQSLEGTQLPRTLQTLTFGKEFNQSLEGIQLPSTLQTLTFGYEFNQSLEGIQLPSTLQTLTFGYEFNQSLEGIQLPSTLQTLTFGFRFNQSLEGIQFLPSKKGFYSGRSGSIVVHAGKAVLLMPIFKSTAKSMAPSMSGFIAMHVDRNHWKFKAPGEQYQPWGTGQFQWS